MSQSAGSTRRIRPEKQREFSAEQHVLFSLGGFETRPAQSWLFVHNTCCPADRMTGVPSPWEAWAGAGDMVVTKEDEISAPWSCPQVGGNEKLSRGQLNEVISGHCLWGRLAVPPNTSQNHSLPLNTNGTVLSQPTPASQLICFSLLPPSNPFSAGLEKSF